LRPKKKQKQDERLAPVVVVRFVEKHGTPKYINLLALLDSGCSSTIMEERFAKKLRRKESPATNWSTAAGMFSTTGTVNSLMQFPEFSETMTVKSTIHLTKSVSPRYDMIIGRDLMKELGIMLDFKDGLIHQGALQVTMTAMDALPSLRQAIRSGDGNRPHNSKAGEPKDRGGSIEKPRPENPVGPKDAQFATGIEEPQSAREAVERVSQILEAKYAPVTPEQILDNSPHLTEEQKRTLKPILYKHIRLFDGTLGKWKGIQHKLELRDPNSKPFACRPYPVPVKNKATLMVEIKRLCKIGVLRKVNDSEYQSPSTIIPKKDHTVRFITDFRKLNEQLKRKPFPLPNIRDTLLELEGFKFGTSLDLNMGYYHIELHPDSRKYCTIVFPFGKYEYLRLPMGLCNSPDIFQEHMSELMCDLEFVRAYIDDVAILSTTTWEDHLSKIDTVLTRLENAGLKVNGLKSFFGRKEFEYLGYILTPDGVKPVPKKVEGMLAIAPPKNVKQLRSFLGMVNYYRDMWIRRSHILAPLNALNKKGRKWEWGEEHQRAFDNIKRVMAKETLLHYPDFNKPFEIHTDASHYQIGAVITQDNKPIAFYTRKLRDGQHNYTTTERELLAIVETLKEFRTILLGHKIKIYTDHKNLTFTQFNTERVLRWRMVLEEYGPELIYIKGPDNIVADALSRLDLIPDPPALDTEPTTVVAGHEELNAITLVNEYMDMYANELPADAYPLRMHLIAAEQRKEKALQEALRRPNSVYTRTEVRGGTRRFDIIETNGKIVVPKSLRKRIMNWYHEQLMHPGITRMIKTIRQHFTWPKLDDDVEKLCKACRTCQLTKKTKKKYGHLPPKKAEAIPWDTLCIDLIGPYTVKEKGKEKWFLHCLTMIDPATGWFEIVEIPSKRADDVANCLEQTWFSRYPWPANVIHDRGSEFMAELHAMLKNDYGCTINLITTRNPQANAIVERVHQTIGNMIRTWFVDDPDLDEKDPFSGLLAAIAFATRATVHTTLNATPTQLVFGRDAMLNAEFNADWEMIRLRKQQRIDKNNVAENAKRIPHNYQIGDKILIKEDANRKFGSNAYSGPYRVTSVRNNGTLRYQKGNIFDTINIRNVTPYHEENAQE
jgi:transposase InsO family protein